MSISKRVEALASALEATGSEEADQMVILIMGNMVCTAFEAEAALLITYLNDAGYDITEMEGNAQASDPE